MSKKLFSLLFGFVFILMAIELANAAVKVASSGTDVGLVEKINFTNGTSVTRSGAVATVVNSGASGFSTLTSTGVSSFATSSGTVRIGGAQVSKATGAGSLGVAGSLEVDGDIYVDGAIYGLGTNLGWRILSGANTACNTTCGTGCVFGQDSGTSNIAVACSNATADVCICAKSN